VFRYVPGLLCGGAMVLMMMVMGRGSRRSPSADKTTRGPADADVGELRDEVARLRQELSDRRDTSAIPPTQGDLTDRRRTPTSPPK
jgi:hypothetical protein